MDAVYKYIQHQEEHHKIQTFTEEYLEFLKEFKVEYDKQYIFSGDDLESLELVRKTDIKK